MSEETPETPEFTDSPENAELVTECAFLVYLDEGGHWVAESNMSMNIRSRRLAGINDFFLGAATIQKDVLVAETSGRTVMTQQQAAAQMAAQMQAQQVSQATGMPTGGIDLSALKGR